MSRVCIWLCMSWWEESWGGVLGCVGRLWGAFRWVGKGMLGGGCEMRKWMLRRLSSFCFHQSR